MSKSLTANAPFLIDEDDISKAWSRAFLKVVDNPGKEISPLIISTNCFTSDGNIKENNLVRASLDNALAKCEQINCEDVAYTIFPNRLWEMSQGNRKELFELYRMGFPRYKIMNSRLNHRGLYFERLTMYDKESPFEGNQLEWIISQYLSRPGVRDSMFQATTFDPRRDQVATARLGFPCLQQLSFVPTKNGLTINAFYATQQIFNKAYGNYLGLAQLGRFMAHEMKIPPVRLNVNIGVAKMDTVKKTDPAIKKLIASARECVSVNENA